MDVFCMLVSTLSNSETFNQWQGTSSWHTFPLAVHRLVAHADWTHTRKSVRTGPLFFPQKLAIEALTLSIDDDSS